MKGRRDSRFKIYIPRKRFDAVVCLGRKPTTEEARMDIAARVELAVSIFRKSAARYLILSGGYTFSNKISEASYMKRIALGLGIKKRNIILEEHSTNTYENAVEVRKIAKQLHINSIAVVTSNYHTLRAGMLFRKQLSPLSVMLFGSPYPLSITLLVRWLRELLQILKAEVLGVR
ncbi:MAG: YdcF family protein [Candidatus Micrarchaeia archaeon]